MSDEQPLKPRIPGTARKSHIPSGQLELPFEDLPKPKPKSSGNIRITERKAPAKPKATPPKKPATKSPGAIVIPKTTNPTVATGEASLDSSSYGAACENTSFASRAKASHVVLEPDVSRKAGPPPKVDACGQAPKKREHIILIPPPAQPATSKGHLGNWIMAFIVVVALLLTGALTWIFVSDGSSKPEPLLVPVMQSQPVAAPYLLEIRPGMSARQVSQLLYDAGVVPSASSLVQYLEGQGLSSSIQVGSFLVARDMAIADIGQLVTQRSSSAKTVTVFDGYTIDEVDRMLSSRELAHRGAFSTAVQAIVDAYGLSFGEGWLLPGAYPIDLADSAGSLALAMFSAMLQTLQPMLGAIAASDRSIDDILIVASMIERETDNPQEMPVIAGIIYNRLDSGMPLGIDATTRYETGNWTDPIKTSDLETQTPYNTRRKVGLPPSGIGAPGVAAIAAAVYPQSSDWYYYLHGTDGNIHVATTYDQHLQNITDWR